MLTHRPRALYNLFFTKETMKTFTIASILALAAFAASATEITVSGVRNSTGDNVTGSNIAVAQAFTPKLTATAEFENTAGKTGTNADTYAVGARYTAYATDRLTVTGVAELGYADSLAGKGAYAQFGGELATPVTANLTASLGLNRQLGTSAVNAADRTEATVGLRYAVAKNLAVKGSVALYNDTPGNKATLGVAYSF